MELFFFRIYRKKGQNLQLTKIHVRIIGLQLFVGVVYKMIGIHPF